MIPVQRKDVVDREKRETYRVLITSDQDIEGLTTVGIGPFSTLNTSAKLVEEDNGVHDAQILMSKLLENTKTLIRKIRIGRDEHTDKDSTARTNPNPN